MSYLFLIIFSILIMPYIIEALFDYMGWLSIPEDQLMSRYLALTDLRRKNATIKKNEKTTLVSSS